MFIVQATVITIVNYERNLFIVQATKVNVIKRFTPVMSVITLVFVPEKPFQLILMFASKVGAYPSVVLLKGALF